MPGIHIYARVRPLLGFEKGQPEIVKCEGANLKLVPPSGDNSFTEKTFLFSGIAGQKMNNEQCFEVIAKPMADQVLEGYNAVLMAYGQTGCGKTFTMLGKPQIKVVGLIPRVMDYLLQSDNAPKLELAVVEAYSRNVMKIELFDLLADKNSVVEWDKKKGSTTMVVKQAVHEKIGDMITGRNFILKAQAAGHTAPTGKNPESSRGHTMYLMKVIPQNTGTTMQDPSTFVFVDLAGSEGETALTPAFCATHSQEEVLMRRMEGGVINNGLSAIQSIFRELGKHGKVAKVGKTGVRRILLDYISKNTALSVMFMLSPAYCNVGPTTSTLYFAKSAALIKVAPEKRKVRVNWEAVCGLQKQELAKLKEDINELRVDLTNCRKALAEGGDYKQIVNLDGVELKPVRTAEEKAASGGAAAPAAASGGAAPAPAKAKKGVSTAKGAKSAPAASGGAPAASGAAAAATDEEPCGNSEKLAAVEKYLNDENDDQVHGSAGGLLELKQRTPEEIMEVEDLSDLTAEELFTRCQGLEFLLEQERNLRLENEKNKDLFIEYLTDGMNSLRKKMRKLAKAHELLKKKHSGK